MRRLRKDVPDSFAFTTGHTPDEIIANFGVVGVRQVEHAHDYLRDVTGELVSSQTIDAMGRSPHRRGELQGLSDRKMREMLVNLYFTLALVPLAS